MQLQCLWLKIAATFSNAIFRIKNESQMDMQFGSIKHVFKLKES